MGRYEDVVALESEALAASEGGRHGDALLAHARALDLARQLNRPRLLATLFERLGRTLDDQGSVQDAVIAYESGLKALAGDQGLELESTLARLGAVGKGFDRRQMPVPDLYSPAMAQSLDATEADPSLPIRLLIGVGNAYLRQPQESPALNAYLLALARPEIADAPVLRAYALSNLGEIHRRRGQIDEAATRLAEALRLFEEHAEPLERRRILALLAGIARDRQQPERAAALYDQALALYALAGDPRGEGRTYAGLGRLYLEQRRFADAELAYRHAAELATKADDEETLWHAFWGLARCQRVAGRLDDAVVSLRRSLDLIGARQGELRTDEGKVTFLDSVQDVFDELILLHLDRAQGDPGAYKAALDVAEEARGRALNDLVEGRVRRRPETAADLQRRRRRPTEGRVAQPPWAQMAPGVPVEPDPKPWVQMAAGFGSGPSGLPSELPIDEPLGGEEVAAPTPPPLARLVFHVLADRTAVFAVRPDGEVHGHVAALGSAEIADRVAQLRRSLGADDPRGLHRSTGYPSGGRVLPDGSRQLRPPGTAGATPDSTLLLEDLYTELIDPISAALPDDGTTVVVEPHGALWLVPFAALRSHGGTWLADRWPLLYAPSAQTLDEIRREPDYGAPGDLAALVVGNPSMPKVPPMHGLELELDPLPGAEEEARAIADLFPESRRTLLLGGDADRATVEARAPEHGILHLATHGIVYADDPLASCIALAETADGDGLLTARQVMSLSLPADLVALSACQTGLGGISGDGIIGLSRAFLVAGARAALVSQWSVSDQATAALMAAFYAAYLEIDDKAVALQRAMLALRSRPEYDHPRYWAPFIVVGAEA